MGEIQVARIRSIREVGKDEFWLRDAIFHDPTILGLGELQAGTKEKTLPQGGRLDLLLKNPEDDSMYEVEIQLGETDESHIIRTIEYWDSMKRQWPRRSHTAVLIAETINNRFFNVVNLLSQAVPIIGIQATIIEVGDTQALHFTKILDSYEEPEEVEQGQVFTEEAFAKAAPGALECARWYRQLLERLYGDIQVKYFEHYLSMSIGGFGRIWVNQRKNKRAFFEVKPAEDFPDIVEHLRETSLQFGTRGDKYLTFNTNKHELESSRAHHEWLAARIEPSRLKPAARGDGDGDQGRAHA